MAQDYYELLGVERGADATAIKRAFRKRARELHPDVNPSPEAEEQFRQVTTAYEVLSDDERRGVYDQYGEEGLRRQHWEPQFAGFGNIADIFSAFFGDDVMGGFGMRGRGQGGGRGGATRGENVLVEVELDFREAALGVQREVAYQAVGPCATCAGRGSESEEGIRQCQRCGGQGVVRSVARSILGQVIQESVCPACAGRGEEVTDPCSSCSGTGEQGEERSVTVEIPGGIADGQRIRLTGRGSAGSGGGPAGNLYVDVRVETDDRFVRDGDDLVTVVDMTIAEAALGCVKDVPTVDGEPEEVEFPPGAQPSEVVVIAGRGTGRLRGGGRGDLRAIINVCVPRELSADQRELLERFQATETERNYRSDEGLFNKLRRMLRG